MTGKLTVDEMNTLLTSQALGRIACTDGQQPYIVPVTYTYDGKHIIGQTNEGRKLDLMRKNPRVCFQVERMSNMRNWESVLVYGRFEEIRDAKEIEHVSSVLHDRFFHLMTSSTVHSFSKAGLAEVADENRLKHVLYRINIERMTGRFEKA